MKKIGGPLAIAIAAAIVASGTASAREDFCVVPGSKTRQIDVGATNQLRQLEASTNPAVMRALTGTWFTQTRNPYTGQMTYNYQQFQANGLWQYQDFTCNAQGQFCTRNAGTGLFAVRANPGTPNGYVGILDVSDLNRDHQCMGLVGRFLDANTIQTSSGSIAKRVQ